MNAARAIGVQVQSAIGGFSRNFQTAASPQIIQSYASGDLQGLHHLVEKIAKFSFFLQYIVSLPIIVEIDFMLHIWLVEVPEYTSDFVRILLVITLLDSTVSPLVTTVNATGILRNYQMTVGVIVLSVVPLSYIILRLHHISPIIVFVIVLLTDLMAQVGRLYFCKKLAGLDVYDFIKSVYGRIVLVLIVSLPIPFILHQQLESGFFRLALVVMSSLLMSILVTMWCGMTTSERMTLKKYVLKRLDDH